MFAAIELHDTASETAQKSIASSELPALRVETGNIKSVSGLYRRPGFDAGYDCVRIGKAPTGLTVCHWEGEVDTVQSSQRVLENLEGNGTELKWLKDTVADDELNGKWQVDLKNA